MAPNLAVRQTAREVDRFHTAKGRISCSCSETNVDHPTRISIFLDLTCKWRSKMTKNWQCRLIGTKFTGVELAVNRSVSYHLRTQANQSDRSNRQAPIHLQ